MLNGTMIEPVMYKPNTDFEPVFRPLLHRGTEASRHRGIEATRHRGLVNVSCNMTSKESEVKITAAFRQNVEKLSDTGGKRHKIPTGVVLTRTLTNRLGRMTGEMMKNPYHMVKPALESFHNCFGQRSERESLYTHFGPHSEIKRDEWESEDEKLDFADTVLNRTTACQWLVANGALSAYSAHLAKGTDNANIIYLRTDRYTLLSYTLLSYTLLSYTLLSYTLLSYTLLSYTLLSYTLLSYTLLSYTLLSYTLLSYTLLSYTLLSYTLLSYTLLSDTLLSYTLLSYTLPSYTLPSYTLPSYTLPSYTLPSYTLPSYT
ncbi:hypothetical protein EYF80_019280 [Liparis tanakae]|uniref:Uncharacterized protein n=1 Tax=Liparis tanakae TaxID=230148 RepID=A0A4Z2HYY3_9TELE|nr:hypothetical protein EYF80_019280 [Liparis tanakae]